MLYIWLLAQYHFQLYNVNSCFLSALGAEKRKLHKDGRETRAGKTTILIAHRISTIEKMDKILFIEDGCLAAVGKHEELYATNAEYRKMVDLQRLEEEGGEQNA